MKKPNWMIIISSAIFAGLCAMALIFSRQEPMGWQQESQAGTSAQKAASAKASSASQPAALLPWVAAILGKEGASSAQARFQPLLERAQEAIPTLQQLKSLSGSEAHHTPAVMLKAGAALGAIAQAVHENPALGAQAALFYQSCARDDHYPSSVRALCFSHLNHENGMEVPAKVRQLAANLPRAHS